MLPQSTGGSGEKVFLSDKEHHLICYWQPLYHQEETQSKIMPTAREVKREERLVISLSCLFKSLLRNPFYDWRFLIFDSMDYLQYGVYIYIHQLSW